jgi:hypothetical protein
VSALAATVAQWDRAVAPLPSPPDCSWIIPACSRPRSPPHRRLRRDPGGGRKPCVDQSSLPALQPRGREVLARWARLPEPLPVRALWLDGSTPTSWRPCICSESGIGLSGTRPQRRNGLRKQVAPGAVAGANVR